MPSLRQTPTGSCIICFRYDGRHFQRSLKTRESDAANAAKGRVEHTLYQLRNGNISIPDGVDPGDFIVAGRSTPKPVRSASPPPALADLLDRYVRAYRGSKADSTLGTERTHLRNLQKALGSKARAPLNRISKSDLVDALHRRYETVGATTLMKERQTVISFFRWGGEQADCRVSTSVAAGLPVFQESSRQDRFRTLSEIDEIVGRGGLSDEETLELWKRLYLDQGQVAEVLSLVKQRAQHDYVIVMIALAAGTGMRRGEILRLRWSDVSFASNCLTARSKKQSRQEAETCRDIDLHPELRTILEVYRRNRPHGQYVICPASTLAPLTVNMAHNHFQRPLRGTRWERELPSGRKKVIVRFHTLRHSFISNLAAAGIDQRIIDAFAGHQTEAMRQRYRHLFPRDRRSAIACLSFQSEAESMSQTSPKSTAQAG